MLDDLARAAALIAQAERGVALTGAGFSTAAGIPDFRSAQEGLWQGVDPLKVSSGEGFLEDPTAFYEWARPLAQSMVEAAPTAAHHALYRLEELGHIDAVVTQNVDMLHQALGHPRVYPLHGTIATATCVDCGTQTTAAKIIPDYLEHNRIPVCEVCSGVVKPNLVLFGELLDQSILAGAGMVVAECDLLLIAGTTLSVNPAAYLPEMAVANGARIIVINFDATPADEAADVILRGDINIILPELVTHVESQ